jgi:hypothetical protein
MCGICCAHCGQIASLKRMDAVENDSSRGAIMSKVLHALSIACFVAQSCHQCDQTRRQMDRLPLQAGPELLTNFLANCRAMHAVDLIALLWIWIGHDQRRVVTRRTSKIFVVPSAVRKQDAAMWGQTCVAQVVSGSANCRRSPLASATNSLASTFGAKTGKAITAEPRSRTTARAEKDLNIWEADFGGRNPTALGDHVTNN